ncbi:MAG: hypothetical protein DWQ06_02210 [Calditrichaeota bacterium]|nr:MAG: hypothetical protein DWQ06_02210 [Calditrichota bacterium]
MFYFLITFAFFIFITNASAEEKEHKFLLKGYGEAYYSHFDFGPDQKSSINGASSDSRAIVDITRMVLEMKYRFQKDLYLETEVEFEHGGTGGALELEYEEFGEFESEVEKGGEVVLEGFHITKSFSTKLNFRFGHFIIPVGLLNKFHKPTQFFTTKRTESETQVIPTTWHETGIQFFGKISDLSYKIGVVNGLDATGFSSRNWIVEGHQKKFEETRATDLAYFANLDYNGIEGLTIGFSTYFGNSTGNRPKNDMDGINGYVTIGDLHAIYEKNSFVARGMFLYGNLQNADKITQKNNRLSNNLQVPRTPVAKAIISYYAEIGYDILSFFNASHKLYPFLKYEYYNTMQEVDEGIFAQPRFERKVLTFGANFFLNENVVTKIDYSMRRFGESDFNGENTFSVGFGFYSNFLKL